MLFFLKYFEISFTSFCDFARMGDRSANTKMGLTVALSFTEIIGLMTWGLNFDLTLDLKVV